MHHNLYVHYCGFGSPPTEQWFLKPDIEIQRLYYILGGTGGYFGSDGEQHAFQKGHIYLFPYNVKHHFINSGADPIVHLFFDFLSTPPIISGTPLVYSVEENAKAQDVLQLCCRILSEPQNVGASENALGEALLQVLLLLLEKDHVIPYHMDDVICRSLAYIQENYKDPISVQQLAEQAGFEVNYYIRRFHRVMKQTPYAYLRNYRLMQAKDLLRSGCSASVAAQKVGYESAASLLRALKQSGTGKPVSERSG